MAEWFVPLKNVAHWIWLPRDYSPGAPPQTRNETVLFHGAIAPPPGTHSVELHVSAEGRYTLWANDDADPLGQGPARTDRHHRSLDSYSVDVSAAPSRKFHLWSQVRWFAGPPDVPLAELHGPVPSFAVIALFLDASGRIVGKTGTGAADSPWQARSCTGIYGTPIVGINAFLAVGQLEHQRSSGWPADWRTSADPSAPGWIPAEVVPRSRLYFKRDPDLPTGASSQPWLIQREIPHTEYRALPIAEIRRLKSAPPHTPQPNAPFAYELLESLAGLKLGPNQSVTVRCDVGHYANAYYRIRLAGQGTKIAITSSEVLSGGDESIGTDANFTTKTQKAFTLDSPLPMTPFTDTYTLDTPGARTFEASHWRAFRFLELTLTAGTGGGTLESFTLHATGYPFTPDYSFEASGDGAVRTPGAPATGDAIAGFIERKGTGDAIAGFIERTPVEEIIRKSVDVSWRTLKCCTWETYMDCPYYEQLQYVGDTRIQCLITYFTTGDTTLPVQALRAFDRSRIYEGLTQSRSPSHGMQLITTFSLIYIMMLEDYMIYSGDDAVVAELRPGIAPILNWFTQFSDHDTGLIGYTPYWPFLDWVIGWDTGIPPHAGKFPGFSEKGFSGANAGINLFHLLALKSAANIYEHTKPGSGNLYANRAAQLKQRLYDTFFDAGRGLVCDVPIEVGRGKLGVWSQQVQALAVLADILSPSEARAAMTTALDTKNVLLATENATDADAMKAGKYGPRYIAPASIYFLFYVAEALAKIRMGEHLWPILQPFREALARGSTTWPETLEPSRSECHAWSSWPLYFFARHILGIAPPSLEDHKIRVRPLHCPPLTTATGHFQTHRGPVSVDVSWKDGQRQVQAKGLGVEVVGD